MLIKEKEHSKPLKQEQEQDPKLQPVSKEQEQQKQRDQQAINQTIEKIKNQQNTFKTNMKLLERLLFYTSPIFGTVEKSTVGKDINGNIIDVSYSEQTVIGYSYPSVEGKRIEDWIEETFDGKVTLDKQTKKIKINK